jgi:hypothetical protein
LFDSIWCLDTVADASVKIALACLAGQADADEPFAGSEDDAAGLVVSGIRLVLSHDGELDPIYVQQLIQRQAKRLINQDIDF